MRWDQRRGSFAELDTARALAPMIRAAQVEIEQRRELPQSLVTALTGQGLFRLLLPASFGGSQLCLPRFIRCVEVIAEADGSTGWCVGQGGVFPNLADALPAATADEIWGRDPNAVVATGAPTGTRAQRIDGGYRLSGRWRFASGCQHASWLAAMSPIVGADGKTSGFGMFLLPKSQAVIGDGWQVHGLRGTGSREYTLHDVEVPQARALTGYPLRDHHGVATGLPAMLLFASAFGAVALGIARRALDNLAELVAGKTPAFSNRGLIDDDLVHAGLAQAEGRWGASRAYLLELAEASAHEHALHGQPTAQVRVHLRLAATSAMRQCGEVVARAYELAGSDAIFEDHPLNRCFQDIHALTQQIQGRPAHFRTVGRVLLGLEPDNTAF